ncbi:putative endo-1,3(4)-beta-glucanase [Lasiodiplodia theobromae]|uniref:Putative endo-1,3(4)-beta-glucanase n=1 Tax=Lasiodiplodia theobromae TaxID=45133 RepID=A0A5N5D3N7_9PEZI|nr:putative endo-1,3(4)-beta-glucanase [Lasiodiplodia theobromae]
MYSFVSVGSVSALLSILTSTVTAKPLGPPFSLGNTISVGIEIETNDVQYTRDAYWHGETFFDNFDFLTSKEYMRDPTLNRSDPTNGFVNYVDESTAINSSLLEITGNGNPRWGVDTTHKYKLGADWGRPSIRLESKDSWTHGLFMVDIAHMPGQSCGVWPAFWTLGSGAWPYNGEVDVLEGVNLNPNNQLTLHTSDNCTMVTPLGSSLSPVTDPLNKTWTGSAFTSGACSTNYSSTGCYAKTTIPNNYGDDFNANGGGIYTMQWTSDFIKIWFFPRDDIPPEAQSALNGECDSPDVSKFGPPQANFVGGRGCNVDAHFKEHRLIFDTTFCGDWAGNAWPSTCPSVAGKKPYESCAIYVGANPEKYKEAYWEVNSITVFKEKLGY